MKTEMQALFSAIIISNLCIFIICTAIWYFLNEKHPDIAFISITTGSCAGIVTLIFNYYYPSK